MSENSHKYLDLLNKEQKKAVENYRWFIISFSWSR